MRALASLATLLLVATVAVPASAQTGPSSGAYVGTVEQDGRNSHFYTTHGDTPCLAIYIPHLYVVTLAVLPPTDTLTLGVLGQTADTTNGVATVSFVANYCTAFTLLVDGTEVADTAIYGLTVEHVILGRDPGLIAIA
jgi:hypothetical protein